MNEYEIRIFKADGTLSLIAVEGHLMDQAAIRSGRMMADKNPYEVWRGVECIWRSSELTASRKWSKAAARRSRAIEQTEAASR